MTQNDIEIRLFGRFEINVFGEPCLLPTSKKGRLLIAYLVLTRKSVSRSYLAGLLWPDSLDETARFNLRQLLSQVRREMPSFMALVHSSREEVAFECERCWVDLSEFNRVVGSNPAEAVSLYRGSLLEEFEEDWIDLPRASFEQTYLGALERLAEESDPKRSVHLLRRIVKIDPFRESAQQSLISRLGQLGDFAGAQLSFNKFEDLLRSELRSTPTSATKRVLKGALSLGEIRKTNLPPNLTSFVGREKEIAELRELLEKTRLLTLIGAGGCGKTRLSLELATGLVSDYPDGAWLIELAALSSPDSVSQRIAEVFDLKDEAGVDTVKTLTDYFRAKRLLLIFDNCEHLVNACAHLIEALLLHCRQLVVLATSRQSLGILGEVSYRVPSLSTPTEGENTSFEHLFEFESVRLFVERAQSHLPRFQATPTNFSWIAHICLQLDGIPLAIEMAAARLGSISLEELDRRLAQRFRLLTGGPRTALPRQQTLRSLIDWSYELLDEREKSLFTRLSVFSAGWTLEAAEGVCNGDGIDTDSVVNLLAALVDKSLVNCEEKSGCFRYRMLETIRQYASDRLAESGAGDRWRRSHVDYFIGYAETAEPKLSGPQQQLWLERLESEHDNLRSAMAASSGEDLLRLAGALLQFWMVRGHYREGLEILKRSLIATECQLTAVRAKALLAAGRLSFSLGDFNLEDDLFEESLRIYRSLDKKNEIAKLCGLMGYVSYRKGNKDEAKRFFEESLLLYREAGDDEGNALGLMIAQVNFASFEGDYTQAKSFYAKGVEALRKVGDLWNIANSQPLVVC